MAAPSWMRPMRGCVAKPAGVTPVWLVMVGGTVPGGTVSPTRANVPGWPESER
jgi:hypothetical protein